MIDAHIATLTDYYDTPDALLLAVVRSGLPQDTLLPEDLDSARQRAVELLASLSLRLGFFAATLVRFDEDRAKALLRRLGLDTHPNGADVISACPVWGVFRPDEQDFVRGLFPQPAPPVAGPLPYLPAYRMDFLTWLSTRPPLMQPILKRLLVVGDFKYPMHNARDTGVPSEFWFEIFQGIAGGMVGEETAVLTSYFYSFQKEIPGLTTDRKSVV